MTIRIGETPGSPERSGAATPPSASGAAGRAPARRSGTLPAAGRLDFFPSATRAQVTALACTLPKESGRPLSRWSSRELAREVLRRKIVRKIAPSTVRRWLREDRIKPWQHRSWQKPTDPRFLEKAIPVLDLYERAGELARQGELVVCADEKTSIQARKLEGGVGPAAPGRGLRRGHRYERRGALQLFAAILVHTGETIARCFGRKRFVDFQEFLRMILGSLWCRGIRILHVILDNGSTHAPKRLPAWVRGLELPFRIKIHWLPLNASWLDQVEQVFSPLQTHVLTPNHFGNLRTLERAILEYFGERNENPLPIQWTFTKWKAKRWYHRTVLEAPGLHAIN